MSCNPTLIYDLRLKQGQGDTDQMRVTDTVNGVEVPIDLTGAVIRYIVKDALGNTLLSLTSPHANLVITNAANGDFRRDITEAVTTAMPVGRHKHELWIDLATTWDAPWYSGAFVIEKGLRV